VGVFAKHTTLIDLRVAYAWVKNLVWRQIVPEILPWARALLYVNLAAIVASSGIAGWVLWDRKQQKKLWFFRIQSSDYPSR
jgi:hypothetical protein